jgi:hypothetical protein
LGFVFLAGLAVLEIGEQRLRLREAFMSVGEVKN